MMNNQITISIRPANTAFMPVSLKNGAPYCFPFVGLDSSVSVVCGLARVSSTKARTVYAVMRSAMFKRLFAGGANRCSARNWRSVTLICNRSNNGTFPRTKAYFISPLDSAWRNAKLFFACLANKLWGSISFVFKFALERTKLLTPCIRPLRRSGFEYFSTTPTAYNRLADYLVHASTGTKTRRLRTRDQNFIILSAIFTYLRNKGVINLCHSAPFGSLCRCWGRVAKVSTFSKRVITPLLSPADYIIGGV